MLLEFGLKNFFCFKGGATISFELDKNCPPAISQGKRFNTVLAVKGANASGKTHVLKGLSFLGWFCSSSFQNKPDGLIGILPFYKSKKPSELYAKFVVNDVTYHYEITTTNTEVKREVLSRKVGRLTKILERIDNKIVYRVAEFARLDTINLRKNASIISTAHQYQFDELDAIYNFFNNIITNVSFSGLEESMFDIRIASHQMQINPLLLNFVKTFISHCDVGVKDIKISKTTNEEGKDEYFPVFLHANDGHEYPVFGYTESSGTTMLFRELIRYHAALLAGGILVFDEFDRHLHPHILPKLLELFENPLINKNDAQFLFTTHDSEVLNYLGKYRTYLVNKEDNASYAYRLDEIPGDILRNDRPILPVYNEGKIGGVPRL